MWSAIENATSNRARMRQHFQARVAFGREAFEPGYGIAASHAAVSTEGAADCAQFLVIDMHEMSVVSQPLRLQQLRSAPRCRGDGTLTRTL